MISCQEDKPQPPRQVTNDSDGEEREWKLEMCQRTNVQSFLQIHYINWIIFSLELLVGLRSYGLSACQRILFFFFSSQDISFSRLHLSWHACTSDANVTFFLKRIFHCKKCPLAVIRVLSLNRFCFVNLIWHYFYADDYPC